MSTTPDRPVPDVVASATEAPSTGTPSTSWLGRLRRLFGGAPDDGTPGRTVSAARALELVRDGATLVDVRTRAEWRTGHATSAVHAPLDDLDRAARRFTPGATVVVMCETGMRSRSGAARLRAQGFTATSLSGGIGAWRSAGGPVRR
jgi:rhodanese-related sulfurtransferase